MPRNAGRGPHHAAMLPIAVVGSLNIDLVWRVGRFPAPGENVFTRSFEVLGGGGKGGNQAVALGRLGAQVRLATPAMPASPTAWPRDLLCAGRFVGGAIICTAVGAQTVMPDHQQVERLLAGTL